MLVTWRGEMTAKAMHTHTEALQDLLLGRQKPHKHNP